MKRPLKKSGSIHFRNWLDQDLLIYGSDYQLKWTIKAENTAVYPAEDDEIYLEMFCIDGIPYYATLTPDIPNLPPWEVGVINIVPLEVRLQVPWRTDLVSPIPLTNTHTGYYACFGLTASRFVKLISEKEAMKAFSGVWYSNQTPHKVHICKETGEIGMVIPISGQVARVDFENGDNGYADIAVYKGVAFKKFQYKNNSVPESIPGTVYIVSRTTRRNLPFRFDIVSPGIFWPTSLSSYSRMGLVSNLLATPDEKLVLITEDYK